MRNRMVIVAALFLFSCSGLPSDFESLSLDEKVAAYAKFMDKRGWSNTRAVNGIASHGAEAAAAMIPSLRSGYGPLPRYEAAMIVWFIAIGEADLKGTEVEDALCEMIGGPDHLADDEREMMHAALIAIESDLAM
jgi:hypothetical protein